MSNTHTSAYDDDRGKSDVAKEHAADLKDHAAGAGQDLGQSAKAEAKGVVRDAQREARGLFDSVSGEAQSQLRGGQAKLAQTVREFAAEVGEMADGGQRQGQASQVARTIADSGDSVARWLENNEPGDALDSVRRYASRNPMTFLAIAAGAGLLVGRFARGFQAEAADDDRYDQRRGFAGDYHRPGAGYQGQQGGYPQTGYGQQASYTESGYAQPTQDASYARAHGFDDVQSTTGAGYQPEAGAQGQTWQRQSGSAYDENRGDRR